MPSVSITVTADVVLDSGEWQEKELAVTKRNSNIVDFYLDGELIFSADWQGNMREVFRDCLRAFGWAEGKE